MSRQVVTATFAFAVIAAMVGSPAGAQGAPITLYVPMHQALVVVVGPREQPVVRVLDPDGRFRALAVTTTPTADGNWLASFNLPTTLTDRVLLEPGDIVEIEAGGAPVRVTVPELSASADASTDTVRGVAKGFAAVLVQPHYDVEWQPGKTDPDGVPALVDADGAFQVPFADKFDFAPGTMGTVLVQDAAGNVFASEFAPAYATAYWDQPVIILRADPTLAPWLVSRDPEGDLSFRIRAIPYGGSVFFAPLFDPNDPAQIPQPLEAGHSLVAEAGPVRLFEEWLPRVTAGIDRPADAADGVTAARAAMQVKVRTAAGATPVVTGTLMSGADGAWRYGFSASELGTGAEIEVLSVPHGAVAHHTTGHTLGFSTSLYSHRLAGTLRGRGANVDTTYTHADGAVTEGLAPMDGFGHFEVELYQQGGTADRVAGGVVNAAPSWGPVESASIPRVTAKVAAGLRILEGEAPPNAVMAARIYTTPVDLFLGVPYDRPYIEVSGRADGAGQYRLTCPGSDCAANYGYVDADTGSFVTRLQWVAAPLSEMDVTRGVLRGYATAGESVSVGLGGDFTRSTVSAPPLGHGLPDWTVDASVAFPTGLPVGTLLHLVVGGSPLELNVPPLSWVPDTAADVITGTGPPGRVLYVLAVPPAGDAARGVTLSVVVIGPGGRWQASFPGFDLRSGDGVELLMPYPGLVARWFEDTIAGNDPPTPTPAPSPWQALLPDLRRP